MNVIRIKKSITGIDNKGSYTVEATVIISMVVLLINAILFLTFFLYNRVAAERAAAAGALRGSQQIWESNSVRIRTAEEEVRYVLTSNTLGADSLSSHAEASGDKVKVGVDGSIHGWEHEASFTKKSVNPVMILRGVRKVKALAELSKEKNMGESGPAAGADSAGESSGGEGPEN